MTDNFETSRNNEEESLLEDIRGELNILNLGIKKDCFKAEQNLKDRIKALGFYDGDESGENISFNIVKVKRYLESIKNKTWTDLDVKSSKLEKGVRTIAIQIAINYINMKNGGTTNKIELIDGVRGNKTWKGVKEFQIANNLKNKDGLPGRETINKILELLGGNTLGDIIQGDEGLDEYGNEQGNRQLYESNIDNTKCISLLKSFKIDSEYDTGYRALDLEIFEKKLGIIGNKGELEGIIFNNPQIRELLASIITNQGKEIENMRLNSDRTVTQDNNQFSEESDDNLNKIQSWDDYKSENFSQENFEQFILSDEGVAIIINELISHIDTTHTNENGEYDRFYNGYSFSPKNLEIKLKSAWENKMHEDYYAEYNDEKMEKLSSMSNGIIGYVDKEIGDYIKSGKDNFDKDIIATLEGFLSEGIEDYGGLFENLYSDYNYLDSFLGILSDKIKKYKNFVLNEKNVINLNTGDKQVDLQLKCYLYIYARISSNSSNSNINIEFEPNRDAKYYDDKLSDWMMIILSKDDKSLENRVKNKKLLEHERKLDEERKARDIQRRLEVAKRNRERNDRLQSRQRLNEQGNIGEIQVDHLDPNHATGPEIAAEADLGKKLTNYNLNIEESEKNELRLEEASFIDAWREFIKSHDSIKSLITQEDMRNIFDISSNTISIPEWIKFKETNPLFNEMSPDEIETTYNTLSSFSSYFNDAKERLSNNSSEMKLKVNETVKTYAIGAVIDNVRDTFGVITEGEDGDFKGFQLNKENPVRKVGDDIIISGSFDGSEVKVRYNLITGELFMNTFLHKLNPNKIIIGESSSIDYPIGVIKPFNDVLNDYYQMPPRSHAGNNTHNGEPGDKHTDSHQRLQNRNSRKEDRKKLLNSQIVLIGEAVKNNTESQTQKNSAIIKFMKTFNIMQDSGGFQNLEFNKGSNLFDIIQIIDNTADIQNGNIESLEYFNNIFMPTVMEYSGLKWGENNEYQDKENEKSKKIFSYEGDNENIQALKDSTKYFNPKQFSGIANFQSQHQLGFTNLIINGGKFITGNDPNRKLDRTKMDRFINDLETEYKESDNLDSLLEKQLHNI